MTIKAFFRINPVRFIGIMINVVFIFASMIFDTQLLIIETTALKNNDPRTCFSIIAIEFGLALFNYLVQGLNSYLIIKQEQQYNVALRDQITDHYYLDGQDHLVAQVQNRLTNDLVQNNENYLEAFIGFVSGLVTLVLVFILLITIHWSLLITIIAMTLVSLLVPKLIAKPLQQATMQISASNQQYLDCLNKWLNGLDEIRRYLAGEKLFQVTAKAAKKLEDANVKQTGFTQCLSSINSLIEVIFSLMLFLLAGFLFLNGKVAFGVIVAASNCEYYMNFAISKMVDAYGQIKGAQKLNTEIAATCRLLPQLELGNATPAAFSTHNLSLGFPNGEKLFFPDIAIQPGEKILFTGDSGSGKTTLFKLILRQIKPNTGEIVFKDQSGKIINPDMSQIGYIPQDPILFPVSIADNMTMFNKKLQTRLPSIVAKVHLDSDIAKFDQGLNERIDLNKLNISGGQRQKIVLVRAMVHQSKIILIDEGTSAIDQKATMAILREVTNTSATVVFIAHNFNAQMKQLFDREIHLTKLSE